MIRIPYTKTEAASEPYHGSKCAAGYDLTAASIDRVGDLIIVDTGIAVQIPDGMCGKVMVRSSLAWTGWENVNGVGLIDSDYRGTIKIFFRDLRRSVAEKNALCKFLRETGQAERIRMVRPYKIGDRIAQLIVQPCNELDFLLAQSLSNTARGVGGYGSTGA